MTSTHEDQLSRLQQKVWDGSLPLEIRLASEECRTFDQSDAYLIQAHRISYLPLLLPRIYAFFRSYLIDPDACASHHGWFSYEDVPLKWHYPVGLLYDLYSGAEPANPEEDATASTVRGSRAGAGSRLGERSDGGIAIPPSTEPQAADEPAESEKGNGSSDNGERDTLPWRLTVHFTELPTEQLVKLDADGKHLLDAFRNSVKEAAFIRHGTGKVVMSLGYDDSTQLWRAVEQHDLALFNPVNAKLLNPPALSLKHIPIRLYLPNTAPQAATATTEQAPGSPSPAAIEEEGPATGTLRVIQSLVTPSIGRNQPQTLGTALNTLLPTLFPSRRSPLLALPVLHGAVVPLAANLEELARTAAYADGFLHVAVKMMG